MKILLLNRSYYPNVGGIENSLYYLSREYQRLGHEVTILTEEIPGVHPKRREYAEIITFPRYSIQKPLLPILPTIYRRNVAKWIYANKQKVCADLVICRDPMLGLAYLEVFPRANITYIPAVVIKYYNRGIRKASSITGYIKEILRCSQLKIEEHQQKRILDLSQKVLVFSENVKGQLLSGHLCKKGKMIVCHPGVADKFLQRDHVDSLDDGDIRFVFVGRFAAEKNLEMLIHAFSQLQCKNKRLILVGDGVQRGALEAQVKRLSLEGSVLFIGETTTPEKYYQSAHFFVLPSAYESFGQVVIEALACGLPVIGFSSIKGKTLTAVDELVQDGVTGFICQEFSRDALKAGMERAINIVVSDTEKYLFMRAHAAQFVRENCSWYNLAQLSLG